ncbi:hypothetical protein FN976_09890 [Caenimonas sedimenti]|uniref:Uncharacterized protein n=1 Tax=Caenimonas sedimenti TaxID=2596921 RepID=A0A562ZRK9_9BURK|nr:hypothetical protein [Caenimonas sedimenti]TWO71239.1 hypothetical protein FN976_09890 [Caenimonas sedimenti]
MARPPIRLFKRALAAGARPDACAPAAAAAQASALALLSRSVAMGHRRLALLRLLAAVRVGAVVPASDWAYCGEVASQVADGALRGLFAEAERVGVGLGTARGAHAALARA